MLQNMDKTVEQGSKWHVISIKWVQVWQKYTYFDLLSNDK